MLPKFIKVPVILYDVKTAELTKYSPDTAVDTTFTMIDPLHICYYRPSQSDDDADDFDNTLVHFLNGGSFHVNLRIEKFEKLISPYNVI